MIVRAIAGACQSTAITIHDSLVYDSRSWNMVPRLPTYAKHIPINDRFSMRGTHE